MKFEYWLKVLQKYKLLMYYIEVKLTFDMLKPFFFQFNHIRREIFKIFERKKKVGEITWKVNPVLFPLK